MNHTRRITLNSLFLLSLTFSNYFVGLLLFPFISRILSVEGFGLVGFGMAYALVFQSVVEYGFMISITARISANRESKGNISRILSSTMLAKIILAALACILFIGSAIFVQTLREHPLVMTLFFLSGVAASMIPDFYFRGIEQMKSIAIRSVLIKLLSVFAVIILVNDDTDIAIVPAALLAGNLIAVAIAFIFIWRDGIRATSVTVKDAWFDLKEGFFLFLSRIAVTINQALGTFILGLKYSPASQELGMFVAATRIASAGEMMITPVSDSLYPHMINKKDYQLFKIVYLYGVVAWFFACAFVFFFAPEICTIVLGPAYTSSGDVLRILLIGTFLAFSSNLFGYNALAPIGLIRHANIALLVSLGINAIAFFILHITDQISLTSVATVAALTNLIIFSYRGAIFYRHRHTIKRHIT